MQARVYVGKLSISFVDPGLGVGSPVGELFSSEPKSDFVVGGLNSVGAVDDVSSDINAEVSADGSGGRVEGLGGTEHLAASEDGVVTFPNHSADGA